MSSARTGSKLPSRDVGEVVRVRHEPLLPPVKPKKASITLLVDEERVVGAGGRGHEERASAAVGSPEHNVGSMREVSSNLRFLTLRAENGGQRLFELGGTGSLS